MECSFTRKIMVKAKPHGINNISDANAAGAAVLKLAILSNIDIISFIAIGFVPQRINRLHWVGNIYSSRFHNTPQSYAMDPEASTRLPNAKIRSGPRLLHCKLLCSRLLNLDVRHYLAARQLYPGDILD